MHHSPENPRIPDDQIHTGLSINFRRRFDQQIAPRRALVSGKSGNQAAVSVGGDACPAVSPQSGDVVRYKSSPIRRAPI
jgi:hypothetical protein